MADNCVCRLSARSQPDDADCILEMSEETLSDILSGTQNVATAQLSGRMKVHGDVFLALRVMRAVEGAERSVA
ncbi:MAG: SCP2 sterol-binding domain-containing protein [Dehalococcoidia bacterium]